MLQLGRFYIRLIYAHITNLMRQHSTALLAKSEIKIIDSWGSLENWNLHMYQNYSCLSLLEHYVRGRHVMLCRGAASSLNVAIVVS